MTTSLLVTLIGLAYALPHIWGVLNPSDFGKRLRTLPRSYRLGLVLMIAATGWFLWRVSNTDISDFAPYKNYMYAGFAAVGIGCCFFVRDFLAVRGFAVLLLLLAATTVEKVRWLDSDWRLVMVTWAYVWVIAGMWFTISPWRMRNWIEWWTATEGRTRIGSASRAIFGLGVAALGLTVLR